MIKRNSKNERIKRQYVVVLKHSGGKSEQTIRQVEKAIQRYETFTNYADFGGFNQQKAMVFKADLAGQNLAKATIFSALTSLKRFLGWLATQPGFKLKINPTDIEFLNLSEKDIRAAKAPADRAIPTPEQVLHVVENMPDASDIDRRNRALIAFIAITGTRDGAAISLRVKHFDPARNLITQNPNEVKTKFSKRISTFLLPVDDKLKSRFLEWYNHIKTDLFFGNDDPLFPKTAMTLDENDCFKVDGLSREFWANATPVRDIFRTAFMAVGLPYYSPHTFRHMLMQIAYQRKLTPAQLKAWSQNLGHESLLTSLTSYGTLPLEMQGQLIAESAAITPEDEDLAEAIEIAKMLRARRIRGA